MFHRTRSEPHQLFWMSLMSHTVFWWQPSLPGSRGQWQGRAAEEQEGGSCCCSNPREPRPREVARHAVSPWDLALAP